VSTVWIVTLSYRSGKKDATEFYLEPGARTFYAGYPAERITHKELGRLVTDYQILEEEKFDEG
jgi:hypothetical protein